MEELTIIDIVLSIYNQEKIIPKVLYGIFINTTTPFNLILIFDGCTDSSRKIAESYIKKFNPKNLRLLTIKETNNVYETRANNVGFKQAKEEYLITLQDDVVIKELGWERRLTLPLRMFRDVLGVTGRVSQDIESVDLEHESFINRAGRELGTLNDQTFAIRDVINRGPIALRTEYLRTLNFLDEEFAPSDLDDADLSLRAWTKNKWKVGAFTINYDSPLEWGKSRNKDSTMHAARSNIKNRNKIATRYKDYLASKKKHDEDIQIESSKIDYLGSKPEGLWKKFYFYPVAVDLDYYKMKLQAMPATILNKTIVSLKKILTTPIFFVLERLLKDNDIRSKGIKTSLSTTVGLTNGPTREAWIEKNLRSLKAGAKILDAGAGELKYKKFCTHLDYVSQDFGQYDGHGNREGNQEGSWDNSKLDIVSDITKIPVKSGSFDAILCIEVFEHIPDPISALKEFSRILKPGGKLILTVPFCSLTHFAPYYFQNGLSKYWYQKFLPQFGFKIDELSFNGNYFEYLAQEIRRLSLVEKQYSKTKFTSRIEFWLIQLFILRKLKTMSDSGERSSEFLCFGIHVLGTKKR